MKFIPNFLGKTKNKISRFVVLDIGLGRVNVAIFDSTQQGPKFVGVGRRSFNTADTVLDATLEATDALGAVVDELPKQAMVGVCGGKLETITKIARYEREKPKQSIDEEEIEAVLEKLSQEPKNDLKVFFSTVTGAKIDGVKVTNPLGLKGEKAEISCFIAFKPEEELAVYDQIIEELEIKPEKFLPTAFAVSKMYSQKNPDNSLLLRIGLNKTETSLVAEGHLVKVSNFDLGTEQIEFFDTALEIILKQQKDSEKINSLWLYADSDEVELEKAKEAVEKIDWKNAGFNEKPTIELASGEENFGPSDMGLLSLSLEEIFK